MEREREKERKREGERERECVCVSAFNEHREEIHMYTNISL